MNCVQEKLVLVVESIKALSCPEDVSKLPNLIKYWVCFLSCWFLFVPFGYFSAASLSVAWGFSLAVAPARATSGIRASQVHREIVYRFQEH